MTARLPAAQEMGYLAIVAELRLARVRSGLSQSSVAYRMGPGVRQRHVSNWECDVQRPRARTLLRWAEALGYRLALIPVENASVEDRPIVRKSREKPMVSAAFMA